VKARRDRAMLATLLYHALRRDELCRLTAKDFNLERRGGAHLKVSGKGGKTRYVAMHPAAGGLITDYLKAAGHGTDDAGALFRLLHHWRDVASQKCLTTDAITRSCERIRPRAGSRSECIPCAPPPPPTRLITRPTLSRCRSGYDMQIFLRLGFTITARRRRKIRQCSR
jgi:integrase